MNKNYTLCFDTCLEKMYLTLALNNEIVTSEVIENHDSKYHSAFLISTISNILNKNKIKPADLSLIGINIGPGSFTGIRACTTAARVMAQQLNIRAAGVSSLEILSQAFRNKQKPSKPVLTALDARKNKAYLYLDNEIKGAVEIDKVKELAQSGNYEVLTDAKLEPVLGGTVYQTLNLPLGETLCELILKKAETSDCDWRKLKPLYIQPPPMG
ncbi:tRNA (adenosine(37)-N6)-threonylcarbamoyltransferase complex dimerization subunit type 1 TsaB [Candidatus Gastranaerophilales bacterium]|nr:MAG: tRNA (adenosine(37)-N6)-threonylcarbamoyltransferase complex dimerization subunit type 1 TsaB [Candidatus Gastranaerophilales bacterium]